jgi:hypothetical protein
MLRDQPKLPFDQRLRQEALRIQEQVKSMPPAGTVNFWFARPATKDGFARQRMAVISRT